MNTINNFCQRQHCKEIFYIYVLRTTYQSREAMPPSAHDEQPRSLHNKKIVKDNIPEKFQVLQTS